LPLLREQSFERFGVDGSDLDPRDLWRFRGAVLLLLSGRREAGQQHTEN
jgi:hypothetical protein